MYILLKFDALGTEVGYRGYNTGMEKLSDADGSERFRVKAKYLIDAWTPRQVAAVSIAAIEAGYDVEYEMIGKNETAMILLGDGNNLLFNMTMIRILSSNQIDNERE